MANDTLKRKIYADKIAEEIEGHYNSRTESSHNDNIVFAISGKWGEGKTELLNLLEPKLTEKGFTVVRFNPWQYSHEDISLKRSFLRVVKEKIGTDFVDLSDLYYDRTKTIIDWKSFTLPLIKTILIAAFVIFIIIPVFFNIPVAQWWDDVTNVLKNLWGSGIGGAIITALIIPLLIKTIVVSSRAAQITTAEEFEDKFKELLNGKTKIVIFIDDLDRCTSKTVKTVLDSLRTFFSHPECSYVITGDHTVIERYAAEELNPKKDEFTGKDIEEGRRFLKKLFDVYWRLPLATPKVFKEFIADEIKKSGIILNETQDKNIKNYLLDDGFFERNPRHVKRFITALKFALESVKAQSEELNQENGNDDTEDQKKSIQEILNNPDLLAKVLLIQEKFYPVYEKLILYPAEIINHEKMLRGSSKPGELTVGGKTIFEILEKDEESLKNYASLINLDPEFTDVYNSTIYDPTNFIAFSGATGLPSLKGPDEANFPQYLKAGQLIERLGSNLEAVPKEKRERFVQRALQIFDYKDTVEQEKVNIVSESLKEAILSDEWAAKLDEWKQKLFTLPAPQQNSLAKDFWTAVLQKSPELIAKIRAEQPQYFETLWPVFEAADETAFHFDTKSQLEIILKDIIGAQPLNLKGVKIYLDKIGSKDIEKEVNNKLVDLPTAKTYYEHCQTFNDPDSQIVKVVWLRLKGFVEDFVNIDWVNNNRDFVKSINLFDSVKNKISQWAKDQKQLIKIAGIRGNLELTETENETIRNQAAELIHKSADLQFIEDANIQALLDKESKKKIFDNLTNVFSDNNESPEKRKKAGSLLGKSNNIWSGVDINDVYSSLKQIKKLKLGRNADLKEFLKTILDSWGYNEAPKEENK
ncbi:MAG: P-loop NTPase fold protein [Dysgonamonadaceae bacterium]|nr:P-loop NTPase fold protein [Dysgonamonadaceae bacterium]